MNITDEELSKLPKPDQLKFSTQAYEQLNQWLNEPIAPVDATEDARAWVRQSGRFDLNNPLLEADIQDLAKFAEQYAAKILESRGPEIELTAVERFIKGLLWTKLFSKNQITAMRSVAKDAYGLEGKE